MNEIVKELIQYKDDKYRDFTSKLIPNISKDTIIGVKSHYIKLLAKHINKNGKDLKDKFLNNLPHKYHEENILHAYIISECKDINEAIKEIDKFLPFVNNWAVCDVITPNVFKKDLNKAYKEIKRWLSSKCIYHIRFAIVSLLKYYLKDNFKIEYNLIVSNIKSDEYYVNMAIAWYFSYALIFKYKNTIKLFEKKQLDKWIHNKSIQKAIESYRIDIKRKKYLKTLKIK